MVNTARGDLIDEEALLRFLNLGRVALAVLDVFAREPAQTTSPLLMHPRVLATPHGVAVTAIALRRAERWRWRMRAPGNWLAAKQSSGVAQPKALVANRAIDLDRDEAARQIISSVEK